MANNGLVESNPANRATGQDVHTHSKFPFGYKFADTHRFGEYHPFFAMEALEGDKIDLHCSHEVRSYTLKAPLLQDISLKKDYFIVPREAIVPMNWEKFYSIPTIGDDVSDNVGTCVIEFWKNTCTTWNALKGTLVSNGHPTGVDYITGLFRMLILGEMFFSEGNLLSSLGAHGGSHFRCVSRGNEALPFSVGGAQRVYTYDEFFDAYIGFFMKSCKAFTLNVYRDDGTYTRYNVLNILQPEPYMFNTALYEVDANTIDLRTALQMMRDNPFKIANLIDEDGDALDSDELAEVVDNFDATFNGTTIDDETVLNLWKICSAQTGVDEEDKLDLARLHAYNIVCSHFYSNDHVDYVYSAQLYRELIGYYVGTIADYVNGVGGEIHPLTFDYNGIKYQYDFLSAAYYTLVTSFATNNANKILTDVSEAETFATISYFQQIFGFRRSLRFLDYFTGARTQPLAVAQQSIDINVDGTAGTGYSVSAINVTKGIQAQRLANAVNRFGRKWEDYIAGMSGKRPAPDYHNPFYLSHTSDIIYGAESEFTQGAEYATPQNITSVFRSNGGKYAFQIECDRPSIIIGIAYYDIERFYGKTTERQFFHANRYDMFNKYMQFIGDQPIYKAELGLTRNNNAPVDGTFAYTNRHMEYKQRYSQCAGGFNVPSTDLNKWLYKTDNENLNNLSATINPSFIRSWNAELDQYYISLTGFSLGTYWHFIVKSINNCEANRQMAYAPSIL